MINSNILALMSLKTIFPIDKWNFHSNTILDNIPANDQRVFFAHSTEAKYKKGAIIFREGSKPFGIYYIKNGTVKKYKIDNFGKEQIIYVANTGELIGYHAVLAHEHYPDSAATLEDCDIVFIPSEDFFNALAQSQALSKELLKTLSHEFGVLINSITVYAQRPVRERVAIALIMLREKFKKDARLTEPVTIDISRDDIANIVGTTRENVTRFITEFKNDQLISKVGRKIIVTNIKKLVEVSNYE